MSLSRFRFTTTTSLLSVALFSLLVRYFYQRRTSSWLYSTWLYLHRSYSHDLTSALQLARQKGAAWCAPDLTAGDLCSSLVFIPGCLVDPIKESESLYRILTESDTIPCVTRESLYTKILVQEESKDIEVLLSPDDQVPLPLQERSFIPTATSELRSLLLRGCRPPVFLQQGDLQTFFVSARRQPTLYFEREPFSVPTDHGHVYLDHYPSLTYIRRACIASNHVHVVILHGLSGGSHESYIRDCVLQLFETREQGGGGGITSTVMNARGCGFAPLTTPRMFNGGYTDDVHHVIQYMRQVVGDKVKLLILGFSLGANVVVKYLGEQGAKALVDGGCALACPYDFQLAHETLTSRFLGRWIYTPFMAYGLKKVYKRHKEILLQDERPAHDLIEQVNSVYQFDEHFTRRAFDYDSVESYYADASSHRFVQHIQRPCLLLHAYDDPVCPYSALPLDAIRHNPNVLLVVTRFGGHLGWFESVPPSGPDPLPRKHHGKRAWAPRAVALFCAHFKDE